MKGKLKRHLSKVLVIILTSLAFSSVPFPAYAENGDVSREDAETMVYELIKNGIENLSESIGISDYPVFNEGEINAIVSRVVKNNPKFFYFEGKGSTAIQNGKIVMLYPVYTYNKSAIPSMKEAFERYQGIILSQVNKNFTDFEKALFIYTYLSRNFRYDEDSSYDDAYNLIKNGSGSSLAFAKLTHCLLSRLGIEVVYAHTGGYYFNAIKIKGGWYYFDAAQGRESVGVGMVNLNTFLISDLKAAAIYGKVECDTTCNITAYDSAKWREVFSGFAYSNGKWYFSQSVENGGKYDCHILTWDFSTGKSEVVKSITLENWKVWSDNSRVYTQSFASVVENNGYIYYNTPTAIMKYDPATDKVSEAAKPSTDNGYIYGINIIADRLYYKIEKEYSIDSDLTSDIKLNEVYTVKFTDGGKVVKEYKLEYGKTIPDTTIPANKNFNKSFWDYFTYGMTAFGDAEFTALHINLYTYKFIDEDGTVLKSITAKEGVYILPPKSHPEKESTDTVNYSFAYWEGFTAGMRLVKDIQFKAVYEKTSKFKLTFVYLNQKSVFYANPGDTLESVPSPDPVTWSDAEYIFTYDGWENFTPGMEINSDVTFTMKVKKVKRQYTYRFVNYDGNVFYSKTTDYGSDITPPKDKPSYSDKSGYTYIFLEWEGFMPGEKLTHDMVFYASYKGEKGSAVSPKKYNISLYRDDGVFLASEYVYEEQHLYLVSGDEMDYEDFQYVYDFQSWEGYEEGMAVNRNLKLTAIYKKIPKVYHYTFLNNDESVLLEGEGYYGSVIVPPDHPQIAYQYPEIYEFTGWIYKINDEVKILEEGKTLDGDYFFLANYEQAYTTCILTFVDDDGRVLNTQTVDVLAVIEGNLNEIYKLDDKEDNEYTYMFEGWEGFTPNMVVTKDSTFTARYSKTPKETGGIWVTPSQEEEGLLKGKNLYFVIGGAVLLITVIVAIVIAASVKKGKNKESSESEDE